MAQYVAVYTVDPLDPLNTVMPEHVVIHRDDLKRYLLGSKTVTLATRCPAPAHQNHSTVYGDQWVVALGCVICRGWGFRPAGKDKAAEVERVLLSKPLAGTAPAVDDWRERKGCLPAWLVQARAEKEKGRAKFPKLYPASAALVRGKHGPQYRPRK